MSPSSEILVKSKQRVAEHGEVFTGAREVAAMVDVVDPPAFHPETRILEPACGDGNFLVEILRRRLSYIAGSYGTARQQSEYEKQWILALSTLYGVEIQRDNVIRCRERLAEMAFAEYQRIFKRKADFRLDKAGRAVLEANILWGDALRLVTASAPFAPLEFTEWSFAGPRVARRMFAYAHLLAPEMNGYRVTSDTGVTAHLPRPAGHLPPTLWRDLSPIET